MGRVKSSRQSDFSVLEIVLVIVILGIIGFTGWYVYHTKQNTKKLQTNTSTSARFQKRPDFTPSVVQTSYLDIKQLGIQFPIPPDVSDLTYTWANETVTLESPSWLAYIKANDPKCVLTTTTPPADWVGYVNQIDKSKSSKVAAAVTINGKTYGYESWQSACSTSDPGNPSAVNKKQATVAQSIEAAFKQATAD